MNKLTNTKDINNFSLEGFKWNQVQNEMKNKLGLEVYESWLKKISFVEEFNNYLLLSVPTRFIRDWITSRYLDQILQIIKLYKKDIIRIEFKIVEKAQDIILKESSIKENNTNENVSFIKDSYLQYNRIDPNKRFDNFNFFFLKIIFKKINHNHRFYFFLIFFINLLQIFLNSSN